MTWTRTHGGEPKPPGVDGARDCSCHSFCLETQFSVKSLDLPTIPVLNPPSLISYPSPLHSPPPFRPFPFPPSPAVHLGFHHGNVPAVTLRLTFEITPRGRTLPDMNSPATRLFAARPLVLSLAKLFFLAFSQVPLASAAPVLSSYILSPTDAEPPLEPSDPNLWLYLGVSAALVLSGGAFAGLTIALMGQDEVYLQVIQTSGEESEKKNAASVLNLLKRGKHWVLVTLLLSNVITNETLPIVLDRTLGGGWPAVLGSTALIVIFGEIVPQSICVRYGLPIGAWMAPCVLLLMYVMSPVAWPIAKLLDRLLGEDHGTIYKKAGLKTLVTLHKTLGEAGEQLNSDEVTIISAVLDLKEKSVGSIMTPMEDVFTMSADTILDEHTMDLILSQGYSRIPIHAPDHPMNFVGMLLVKMLITYDPEDCKRVREFALATLPETRPETSCLDIVNFFQEGKSHMVLVSEYPSEDRGALGVVTLEDVIEELIGEYVALRIPIWRISTDHDLTEKLLMNPMSSSMSIRPSAEWHPPPNLVFPRGRLSKSHLCLLLKPMVICLRTNRDLHPFRGTQILPVVEALLNRLLHGFSSANNMPTTLPVPMNSGSPKEAPRMRSVNTSSTLAPPIWPVVLDKPVTIL